MLLLHVMLLCRKDFFGTHVLMYVWEVCVGVCVRNIWLQTMNFVQHPHTHHVSPLYQTAAASIELWTLIIWKIKMQKTSDYSDILLKRTAKFPIFALLIITFILLRIYWPCIQHLQVIDLVNTKWYKCCKICNYFSMFRLKKQPTKTEPQQTEPQQTK